MELSLHNMRTEVEGVKHELNTYQIEHHIIEGKLIDQEQLIETLRQQVSELVSGKYPSVTQEIQNLEKKIQQLSKKQEKITTDIHQLGSHANDTTTALSQYKEKIIHLEKALQAQALQLQEACKVKEELAKLSQLEGSKIYTVKPGDSLEKIARQSRTTVEEIKKVNKMTSDLIVVDQELLLP